VADSGVLIEEAIGRLSAILIEDTTLNSVMKLVIAMAVSAVEPSDAASVSVQWPNGRGFETTSATSAEVVDLDRVQYTTGQGPCVTATRVRRDVVIDLAHDCPYWPAFVIAAREHGVTSVFSSPLSVRDESIGALNLYSHRPHPMEEWDAEIVASFAASASVVLANASSYAKNVEQNAHLQAALVNRELIGQAKGVLMERHGIDGDEAFDRLRSLSQHTNRKLRVVAREIVERIDMGPTSEEA
jgi:GAF domain-containing protein